MTQEIRTITIERDKPARGGGARSTPGGAFG